MIRSQINRSTRYNHSVLFDHIEYVPDQGHIVPDPLEIPSFCLVKVADSMHFKWDLPSKG